MKRQFARASVTWSMAVVAALAGFASIAAAQEKLPEIGGVPVRTADPASRKWEITNYLKGTPAEMKATLDKDLLDFDAKCKTAEADLRQSEERLKKEEEFLLTQVRKRPDYAAAVAEVNKAQAQVDATKTAPLAERMAASSKLNKLKADVQKIERTAAASNPALLDLRKRQAPLKDRVAKMAAGRAKALEWRDGMVDAIANTYELQGPLRVGTWGIIKGVSMFKMLDDGRALGFYLLYEQESTGKSGEGLVDVKYRSSVVTIILRNPPEKLKAAKAEEPVELYTTWRVTKVGAEVPGFPDEKNAMLVEPMETDLDELMKTIVPLPIERPAEQPKGKGKK